MKKQKKLFLSALLLSSAFFLFGCNNDKDANDMTSNRPNTSTDSNTTDGIVDEAGNIANNVAHDAADGIRDITDSNR